MQFRFDEDRLAERYAVWSFCVRLDVEEIVGRDGKPADPACRGALAALGMVVEGPGSGLGVQAASVGFEEAVHLLSSPVLRSTLASPLVGPVAGGGGWVGGVEMGGATRRPVVVEEVASP